MTDTIPHYDRIRATVMLLENLSRERDKGNLPGDLTRFDYRGWRCGTAACAGGYMAEYDLFQQYGLCTDDSGVPMYPDPKMPGRYLLDTPALSVFLGIDEVLALSWFIHGPVDKPMSAVTAQDIADMMRTWLTERGELGELT